MRPVRSMVVLLTLIACWFCSPLRSDGQSSDLPDSTPFANIGAGSAVVANVDIVLPANQSQIYFQNGAFTTYQQIDKKSPSCHLSTVGIPVVRKLVPGRKLIVTGTRFGNGTSNQYGDTLLFEDDTAVNQLQCSGGHKGPMTIGELKICFGGLFSLVQATPEIG